MPEADIIAERGPIDFLAYLLAIGELTGQRGAEHVLEWATARTAEAMRTVDLLIVLPLSPSDPIFSPPDEFLDLRDAMNDVLLELASDPEILGERARVAVLTGDPRARLAALESLADDCGEGG